MDFFPPINRSSDRRVESRCFSSTIMPLTHVLYFMAVSCDAEF